MGKSKQYINSSIWVKQKNGHVMDNKDTNKSKSWKKH